MGPPDPFDDDNGGQRQRPMTLESRVYLLAERIKNLTAEVKQLKDTSTADKREIITRLSKLEVTYQRIFGIILVFPVLGVILGFIATYWAVLFKPWSG